MHFAVCGAALSTAARGILRRSARCCGADRTGGGAVLRGGRGVPAGLDRHCGATSATAGTAGPAQRMERAVVERAAISGGLGQRGGGRQRRGARGRRRIERRRGRLEGEDLQDVVQMALAADGAQARVAGLLGEEGVHVGDVRRLGVGEAEAFAAAGEVLPAAAAAEQAVVADAMEARRQDVLEEAVDEVGAGQRHALLGLGGVRVLDAVVAVAEGDPAAVDRLDAVVGDGDAVDVAAQVADQRLGVGEGGLDVDHPVLLVAREAPGAATADCRMPTAGHPLCADCGTPVPTACRLRDTHFVLEFWKVGVPLLHRCCRPLLQLLQLLHPTVANSVAN
jgi:hypothetical protein